MGIAGLGRMGLFTVIQIGRVCSTVRLVKGSAAFVVPFQMDLRFRIG